MKNYFTDLELKCPCCGVIKMDHSFLVKLNLAREIAGIPFVICSGYRCEKHNASVGSASTNHTSGRAVDVKTPDGRTRWKIVSASFDVYMPGIGVGKDFVHLDTNHTEPALWTY